MDGDTNVASRQKMVDNFNEDTSYFGMLLTTKTGGVGLVSDTLDNNIWGRKFRAFHIIPSHYVTNIF